MSINILINVFSKHYITPESVFFSSMIQWSEKISFLMVPAFCDQVVAKLVVESDIRKRNLKILLGIVREICTGRFNMVGLEEFR